MSAIIFRNRIIVGVWALAVFFVGGKPLARADAVAELASFSIFPRVNLAQLSKGEYKTVRSGFAGNARYLAVQTAFMVPGSPAETLAKMRRFNPAKYPELKVFLHSESATDFSQLEKAPGNSAVAYLASATAGHSSDLQLSTAEMKQLPGGSGAAGMSGVIASAWAKILSARAQAFASGGSSAQPPYDNVSPPVRPGDELSGLLRGQEKIRQQFSGFLEGTGIGRSGGSIKPEMYWELLSADQKGVLTLGAIYSRSGAAGTIQTANPLYYASGGYYVGLVLQQLWPVEVDGRASTLVWRGDMFSSGAVGPLRGIERIAAESMMIKNVANAIALFRREAGAR